MGCINSMTGLMESQLANGILGIDYFGHIDRFGLCIGRNGGWGFFDQDEKDFSRLISEEAKEEE